MNLVYVPRVLAAAISIAVLALGIAHGNGLAEPSGDPWAALRVVALYIGTLLGWVVVMLLLLRWDDILVEQASRGW